MTDRYERLRQDHAEKPGSVDAFCRVCDDTWPCPTAAALIELDVARTVLERLVRRTPFTPTATGLDAHLTFDQIKEQQRLLAELER